MKKKKFLLIVIIIVLFSCWFIRYKSLNLEYQKQWSPNSTEIYALGDTVTFDDNYIGTNYSAEGYSLCVDDFRIVDSKDYSEKLPFTIPDNLYKLPDRVALVTITLSQQGSNSEGVPLTELDLHTIDMMATMDWDLLYAANSVLSDGSTGIRLPDGSSYQMILPYALYRDRCSLSEWRNIYNSDFWLYITSYPIRKEIQLKVNS